jgi:hypothetical protein
VCAHKGKGSGSAQVLDRSFSSMGYS